LHKWLFATNVSASPVKNRLKKFMIFLKVEKLIQNLRLKIQGFGFLFTVLD